MQIKQVFQFFASELYGLSHKSTFASLLCKSFCFHIYFIQWRLSVVGFVLSCWRYFRRSITETGPGNDLRDRFKSTQDKVHSILGTSLWNGSLKLLMKDLFVCVVNKIITVFPCRIFSSIFHFSCFSLDASWVFIVWSSNLGTVFQLERHQCWKERNSYHHCLHITFLSSLILAITLSYIIASYCDPLHLLLTEFLCSCKHIC